MGWNAMSDPGEVPPVEFVDMALRIADGIDRARAEMLALVPPEMQARCDAGTCDCAYHVLFTPVQVSVGVWRGKRAS